MPPSTLASAVAAITPQQRMVKFYLYAECLQQDEKATTDIKNMRHEKNYMSEIRGIRTPATPPPSGSAPESLYLAQ